MVAADSRFDYLSSADGTWRNELHGVLKALNLKRNLSLNRAGDFYLAWLASYFFLSSRNRRFLALMGRDSLAALMAARRAFSALRIFASA